MTDSKPGAGSPSSANTTRTTVPDVPLDGSTVRVMLNAWAAEADDGPGVADRVHCLAEIEGPESGRKIILEAQSTTIGRAEPADLVLPDPQISRTHCRIDVHGERVVVIDPGSTNGTFVQGVRVSAQADLPVGGSVRLGKYLFRHEFRSREAIEAAQAQWQRERTLRREAAEVQIEIDQVKRQQEVEKITTSDFFKSLTEELDALRPE